MDSQGRKAAASSRGGRGVVPKKQQRPQKRALQSLNSSVTQTSVQHVLPPELHQSILDVFAQAFPVIAQPDSLKKLMQEVKGHLYNRDFSAAFSNQDYLDVYALRWSAARALAYAEILTHSDRLNWFLPLPRIPTSELRSSRQTQDAVEPIAPSNEEAEKSGPPRSFTSIPTSGLQSDLRATHSTENVSTTGTTSEVSGSSTRVKVLCIGGGAGAEIVALAATSRYQRSRYDNQKGGSGQTTASPVVASHFDISAVDIADWSVPVQKISTALTNPPPLPSYASQAAQNANRALLHQDTDGHINVTFHQQDILQASPDLLRELLQNVTIITIMFTLNELFSNSLSKTTALLLHLSEIVQAGAHLVVVDSPGSYSEIQLGKSNQTERSSIKKYPMKWLLDHTLLEVAGKDQEAKWTKVESEDSKWFRIDEKLELKYGVELENCRYQIHVFRKMR